MRKGIASLLRLFNKHLGLNLWAIQTRPLDPNFRVSADMAAKYSFKRLSIEEALEAALEPDLQISESFVRQAFAKGDTCDATFEGTRLVAYAWRTTRRAVVNQDLSLQLHGTGFRYGYKIFVSPQYRGLRISYSNARYHDPLYVHAGINKDIGYIDLHNTLSLKNAYRDPNRTCIGFAGYLKCGPHYLTFRTARVRPHLSFERAHPAPAVSQTFGAR